MYTLLLKLKGVLQSWGGESYFDYRDTRKYPTKSAITGMIACALGRKRDESIDDITSCRFGVRIDNQGELYIDTQNNTRMGNKIKSHNTHREYLADAAFIAGLESNDYDMLEMFAQALEMPFYAIYLGRRSCMPSEKVVIGIRKCPLEDALRDEPIILSDYRQKTICRKTGKEHVMRILIEDNTSETLIKDNPVSFSPNKRRYGYRGIREIEPVIVNLAEPYIEYEDPMKELDILEPGKGA